MKMRLTSLTINSVAFLTLILGMYVPIEGALMISIFMYWAGTAINTILCLMQGMTIILILFAGPPTDDKMQGVYNGLMNKPLMWKVSETFQRILNITAVVVFILNDFIFLPAFYLASMIACMFSYVFMVTCMKTSLEKQKEFEEKMAEIDKQIDEIEQGR
jgi:hypothetical protein